MNDNTISASVDWDERWRADTDRTDRVVPDEEVIEWPRAVSARRALNLSCGIGRHDLAIAKVGFEVDSFDVSQAGVAKVAAQTKTHDLPTNTYLGDMTAQLCEGTRHDSIVFWFFFDRGDNAELRWAIARIYRALRTSGTMPLTMLSKRNVGFGVGQEVYTNFWVDPGAEPDKAHAHCYYNSREAIDLFDAFDIRSLVDIEQRRKHGNSHWRIVAERRA